MNEKYHQKLSWNKDFIEFDYINSNLIVGMKIPSKQEIKAYKSENINLKLIVRPNVFFLLFKIGNLDWCDVTYSNCLYPEMEVNNYKKILQETCPKKLNLMLVDVYSQVIKVYRVLILSTKFFEVMRDAFIEQCKTFPSVKNYNAEVKKIYNKYQPEHLPISELINVSCEIQGADNKEYIDVIYEKLGFGNAKKIPSWIYEYVHKKDNNKGIITKESIPDDLIQKGVVKCKYWMKMDRYLYVELYKTRAVKKRRSKNKNV
ncbi:MAG: hypothetical protein KGD58_17245 [Candidatus Lokiarchaeota archaeon]|nr:hypothetical protein [Candidatus Lokiarchaeota archaeon]